MRCSPAKGDAGAGCSPMNLTATERSELRWTSTATSVAEADALLARLWTSTESRQQITAEIGRAHV